LSQLKQILVQRLEKIGMESSIIPFFIRHLVKTILDNPNMSLLELNRKLHLLGWDDFELDYRTLELATVFFEAQGSRVKRINQPIGLRSILRDIGTGRIGNGGLRRLLSSDQISGFRIGFRKK
jgi:hypothetical protein